MKRSIVLRTAGMLAAVALTVTALSGCAGLATAGAVAEQYDRSMVNADKPKAGECWVSTYNNADDYANWGDDPPVSCSSPHQLYTYAVVQMSKHHTGKLFDSAGYEKTGPQNDAWNSCESAQVGIFPLVGNFPRRINEVDFVPDETHWDAGARWVRCDISVLAVGSLVAKPKLADLQPLDTLVHELAYSPDQFRYCLNDPGGIGPKGPKGPNAVYADCRDHPQWRFKSFLNMSLLVNAPYPGLAYLANVYQQECVKVYGSAKEQTYPYYPSPSTWLSDGPVDDLQCWVGPKQ